MTPLAVALIVIAIGYVDYRLVVSIQTVRADSAGDDARTVRLIRQARVVRRTVVIVLSALLTVLLVLLVRRW